MKTFFWECLYPFPSIQLDYVQLPVWVFNKAVVSLLFLLSFKAELPATPWFKDGFTYDYFNYTISCDSWAVFQLTILEHFFPQHMVEGCHFVVVQRLFKVRGQMPWPRQVCFVLPSPSLFMWYFIYALLSMQLSAWPGGMSVHPEGDGGNEFHPTVGLEGDILCNHPPL